MRSAVLHHQGTMCCNALFCGQRESNLWESIVRTMNQRKVYEWLGHFKARRTIVMNKKQVWSPINIAQSRTHPKDGYLGQGRPTNHISTSGGNHGHQLLICTSHDFGYCKVCAHWMPKPLTAQHKQQCGDFTNQFLQRREEDRSISDYTVTGEKT